MAKMKKPPGTKGEPVQTPTKTLTEEGDFVPLNFRVERQFRQEFRTHASELDIPMVELLRQAFNAYKE